MKNRYQIVLSKDDIRKPDNNLLGTSKGGKVVKMSKEVIDYFIINFSAWEKNFDSIELYPPRDQVEELTQDEAQDLLSAAIGFIYKTNNEIAIYQEALTKLNKLDLKEDEVENWLKMRGYTLEEKPDVKMITGLKLGAKLVNKISKLFQNIMQVINNLVKSLLIVLRMKLIEVEFKFSASPSVSLTFQ